MRKKVLELLSSDGFQLVEDDVRFRQAYRLARRHFLIITFALIGMLAVGQLLSFWLIWTQCDCNDVSVTTERTD